MAHTARRTLLLLTNFVIAAAAVEAQQAQPAAPPSSDLTERRTMAALRMGAEHTITLDGIFDEPIWKLAVPATNFIQQDPDLGQPATEPTEVRIVYTAEALYIGVICFDSDPDGWRGIQRRRDEFLSGDDRFMWVIDTFLDGRSSYMFEMNPSGLMGDSLRGTNGSNRQWDGIWDAAVRRSEIGWTLEIEIPFRTLNFDPDSDTWGINFQRTVRRKNEETLWMGWARNQGLNRMTNAGLLTGLREVSQGHGLDIKPYALATAEASPGRGQSQTLGNGEVGVDLFYNPTPGLRANLTINTDFAQTEVDQRQVNLTRFSLFFPEKRDFFLDGSTFFDFESVSLQPGGPGATGGGNLLVYPFFSRRIGLGANAEPQQINFGTKLTGQVGQQDIGLLHVRTGEDGELVGEDFTVARIKHRFLAQSQLGAIYTRRDARESGGSASHTGGLDFRLATSTFRGDQNLETAGYFLTTSDPLGGGDSSAYGFSADYPNDRWIVRGNARAVEENFRPAVGFVTRTGFRQYATELTFAPRPSGHRWIRRYVFTGEMDLQTDMENRTLSRKFDLTLLQVDFHAQDNFAIQLLPSYERLEEPFAISPGITLPIGEEYTFTRYILRFGTANQRMFALTANYQGGGFYSGTRGQTTLGLTLRARPGLIVYLTGEWNQVKLAEGHFQTRLYRVVGETQFSPWVALVNNIQYDTVSAVLGWQSRFRWILQPGNDLYIVYTHNWRDDPLLQRYATLDRRAASKVVYTYRF